MKKRKKLKSNKRKTTRYSQGNCIRLSVDFCRPKTLQARRERHDIFIVLKRKKKNHQRIVYLTKLSFKVEEEICSFPDKQTNGVHHLN